MCPGTWGEMGQLETDLGMEIFRGCLLSGDFEESGLLLGPSSFIMGGVLLFVKLLI